MTRTALLAILVLPLLVQNVHGESLNEGNGGPIEEIVVFGDSMSDAGNVLQLTLEDPSLIPDPPAYFPPFFRVAPLYFEGRLTNGPNWVDQLADAIDVDRPFASLLGGTNYAFAGAKSGEGTNLRISPSPSMPLNSEPVEVARIGSQIDNYLANHGDFDAGQLVTVWVGANDLRDVEGEGPDEVRANVVGIADKVVEHVRTVADNGARTIVVPGQFDFTVAPIFAEAEEAERKQVEQAVQLFNGALAQGLGALSEKFPDTNIIWVDMFAFTEVLAAGFDNVTEPALDWFTPSLAEDPENYLFWDLIHPTTDAHGMVAEEILTAILEAGVNLPQ